MEEHFHILTSLTFHVILLHLTTCVSIFYSTIFQDESDWPNNGEIDIVEGINNQSVAKTALHTSAECDMYSFVPDYSRTGRWEVSSEF